MGRIKNESLYILDQTVSGNDRLIGSDGDNLKKTKNFSVDDLLGYFQNNNPTDYVLPIASPSTLGGIKIDGTTLVIDPEGILSASTPLDSVTTEGNISSTNIIIDPLSSSTRPFNENLTVRANPTGTNNVSAAVFDVVRAPSATSASSATYGMYSRIKSESTFEDGGVIAAISTGDYAGSGGAFYVYGTLADSRVTGSGDVGFVIGDSTRAKSLGTETNTITMMRGASFLAQLDNINSTVLDIQGFHSTISLDGGTATNAFVALLDFDYTGGSITGDFAYIQIQEDAFDYSSIVAGDARAINSKSALPSKFVGSIEASKFIVAGKTSNDILTGDGTTVSFTNLNADTVDGIDGGSFLRSDAPDQKTSGDLVMNNNIKLRFSTISNSGLEIYHDNTNTYFDIRNSKPLIIRDTTTEVARFTADGLDVTGVISTEGYTVATLPAGTQGDRAYVTDATAPTYLGTLTGGGAVACPVFYDGTNWISG